MNREYAVLYNRSLEQVFGRQAHDVACALNCPCLYTDELLFRKDEQIDFEKCVYFDKDVIMGLRLETMGIRLYNNIGSIELCDDKRRTCELLRREGAIPKTIPSPLFFSQDDLFWDNFVQNAAEELGFPMVAKLAYGSLGKQVFLLNTRDELCDWCKAQQNQPFLLQEFIASSRGRDLRIYVVDGQAIAAMERYNPTDFRSNIGSGGKGTKAEPPQGFEQAAIDACALLGLDFGGVDLLYGPQGEPLICEVNSNALFQELNAVCGVKTEQFIAEAVRKKNDCSSLFF